MPFFLRLSALLLLVLLAACAGVGARSLESAPPGEQSIRLWHKPSNERLAVTYRIGGRYDAGAFAEIDRLFRDRHTGKEYAIDPALIDVIAGMRDKMMMDPETEIELTSGYRSPGSNDALRRTNRNAARNSYHTKGQAADIRMPGMIPSVLELVAKTMQRGGVALYPDSGHVHVDVGPVRGWEVKRGREEGVAPAPSPSTAPDSAERTRGLVVVKPVSPAAKKLPPGFSKTPYARPTVSGKPLGKTPAKKPPAGKAKP